MPRPRPIRPQRRRAGRRLRSPAAARGRRRSPMACSRRSIRPRCEPHRYAFAARPRGLRLRRIRRLGHGRLLRAEEARRARRFPRALPAPRRRGGAAHQPRRGSTWSRALGGGVNDATGFPRWLDENLFDGATFADFRKTRAARLDQRLRHLQPHAVHLRRGDLHRAVQRSRLLSDRRCGGGLGRGADRVHADGDQDLSGRLHRQAAGLAPARAHAIPTRAPMLKAFADALVPLPRRLDALTSSCSTAAWSTITACPASPSRGCRRRRRTSRCRRARR